MQTTQDIQNEVDRFMRELLPAKIVNSQTNANIFLAYLAQNSMNVTSENLLIAARGPLLEALAWLEKPAPPSAPLPEVPQYMEHIRSKADLAALMRDGSKYQQWMRGKAGAKFSARVTYILQHNITE